MIRRMKKSSSSTASEQPLLGSQEFSFSSNGGSRPPKCSSCGEVVGGAAAECAAICCCCPCGLLNLFVLAVYKLPKGICRKALRKKRRRRVMNKGNDKYAPSENETNSNANTTRLYCDELEEETKPVSGLSRVSSGILEEEMVELEEVMWAKFYGGGFWRSPSQSQMSEKFDICIVSK